MHAKRALVFGLLFTRLILRFRSGLIFPPVPPRYSTPTPTDKMARMKHATMSDTSPLTRGSTPTVPQKRPFGLEDEQHVPAVSSPLNPDFANARTRKQPAREQREKKESLRKREAKGVEGTRHGTPDAPSQGKKAKKSPPAAIILSPIRYKLAPPKPTDFDPPRAPVLTPTYTRAQRQFYETSEHVYNRKGFRYTHCIADPAFPSSQYHRGSETEPYGPRMNFEDASSHILFDLEGRSITTEKGYRMARANVGVREGRWYWECKIVSGIRPANLDSSIVNGQDDGGHVRIGWARREASLDTPVGFDAYSYGLRDVLGQKVHMSRPKDFMPSNESFCEGDVIGLEINLPSLNLHRKVVEGIYNKAVDITDDLDTSLFGESSNIIRDRVPIRYKSHLYFEQFEYHPTKDVEELMNPTPVVSTASPASLQPPPPDPNHPLPALRTLPFSSIRIYKNGQLVGTPFTDLLAFLPPASKPLNQVGAREGLDDGMLGYFPAISVFRGGCAEANFGPDFWFPPPDLIAAAARSIADDEDVDMVSIDPPTDPTSGIKVVIESKNCDNLRAMGERFAEQIAEDVVYDLIDEVDFWAQDGGGAETTGLGDTGTPMVNPEADGGLDAGRIGVGGLSVEGTGEIKELVQEEE